MLSDCFAYTESKPPPYKESYRRFNFNVKGLSLLDSKIPLDKQCEWFKILHEQYITKRKFFAPLTNNIVQGLKEISLVNFRNARKI